MKKLIITILYVLVDYIYPLLLALIGFYQIITGNYFLDVRVCGITLAFLAVIYRIQSSRLRTREDDLLDALTKLSLVSLERNRLKETLSKHNIKEED